MRVSTGWMVGLILLGGVLGGCSRSAPVSTTQSAPPTAFACYGEAESGCDLRIYQVMVEAFADGDPRRGYGTGYGPSRHLGDLAGIRQQLDYIASLGVNAIWLTPVFDSCAGQSGDDRLDATGYFACNYFHVDPRFGTNEELKSLIDAAHARGLYVILDGVFGHVNRVGITAPSPQGRRPALTSGGAGYPGQLADYRHPDTLAYFQEVARYWIEHYGIDGWRLDQAYQLDVASLRAIRMTVEQASHERLARGESWGTLGYLVGEVWNDAPTIARTAYGPAQAPALLSAFDFPLRYGLVQALAVEESGKGGQGADVLDANWNRRENYPPHAMPNLMLGNHDLVRFGDLLQRGHFNPADYWLRHQAAFTFLAAHSGPITLYYGEEWGDEVPGYAGQIGQGCVERGLCDDHVARSDGKWPGNFTPTAEQNALRRYLTHLMQLRTEHPALWRGRSQRLVAQHGLYGVLKTAGREQILYLLNVSTEQQRYQLPPALAKVRHWRDLLSGEQITVPAAAASVPVSALSGRLLLIEADEAAGQL